MGSYSYGVFLTTPGGNQAHYHSVIYSNPATNTGLALNNASGIGITGTVYAGTIFPPPPVPYWSLVNQGTIIGATGVDLPNGGRVDNVPSTPNGGITGGGYGIIISGAIGTVLNMGEINGAAAIQGYHTLIVPTRGYGVELDGGVVINGTATYTTALISGVSAGVVISGTPGTVTNYATIMGNTRGVYLAAGGTVTNTWNLSPASRSAIRGDSIGVLIAGGAGQISNGGILRGALAIDGHSPVNVTNTGAIYGISLSGQAGIAGIYLLAGGTINNTYRTTLVNNGTEGDYTELRQVGTINGAAFGIEAGGAPVTVTNLGAIYSDTDNGTGIELSAGGLVTNGNYLSNYHGTIAGPTAIIIQGGAGMLDNEFGSTILSTGSYSSDFAVRVSGTVVNSGIISAAGAGVAVSEVISASTTILPTFANTGFITARYAAVTDFGVSGKPAAQFVNSYGGLIKGGDYGAALSDVTGTVTNDGTIKALGGVYPYFTATGLAMSNSDGTVANGNASITSAYIYGKFLGLYVHNGTGTITNYGTIVGGTGISTYGGTHNSTITNFGTIASRNGTNGTAIAFGRGNSVLVDEPGAVFIGSVNGGSGTNVLILASGLNPGTASGLGTSFEHFASIYVAPGGNWYIDGSNFNGLTGSGGIFENSGVAHVRSGAAFTNDGTLINLTTFDVDPHALFSNAGSEQGGITIQSDGTLHNNLGTIGNFTDVVLATGTDVVVNNQAIILDYGSTGSGVVLRNAGSVTNGGRFNTTAAITGIKYGVLETDASYIKVLETYAATATVTNFGTITGTTAIRLVGGGIVTNGPSNVTAALIDGSFNGINMGAAGIVTNGGTIAGADNVGINFAAAGVLVNGATNLTTARILGASDAVLLQGQLGIESTIDNFGLIRSGNHYAINMEYGYGTITNGAGNSTAAWLAGYGAGINAGTATVLGVTNFGTISGSIGIAALGNTKLVNFGTIIGHDGPAVLFGTVAATLVAEPGAVFVGTVQAAAQSTLELAAGTPNAEGMIANIGTDFVNFGTVLVDPGAYWDLSGRSTFGAGSTLTNDGTLVPALGDTIIVSTSIVADSGKHGTIDVGQGATVSLLGPVASSQLANFNAPGGLLQLGDTNDFFANINGFTQGDTINLVNLLANQAHLFGNSLTITSGGIEVAELTLAGDYTGANFFVSTDTVLGGTDITTDFVPCFLAGTRISTERGQVAVEDLRKGDMLHVVTGRRSVPITWIGYRRVDCTRYADPRKVWPVRISAGAFGRNRPGRDLYLSPDHSIYIGTSLIPVKLLINGSTIAQVQMPRVTYYHVELECHDVIISEGLPTESYLDTGDLANFSNGGKAIAPKPNFSRLPAHGDAASMIWEAEGCAPLVVTGPEVAAARVALERIAAQLERRQLNKRKRGNQEGVREVEMDAR